MMTPVETLHLALQNRKKTPALFIGHGSPMNAIEKSSFTDTLRAMGAALPKPEAVLVVSAHWLTRGTFVATTAKPETMYDFSGFPKALSQVVYPAPGAPVQAQRALELLKTAQPDSSMGLDHGAWSVLIHLFPHADVPVFQLSLDGTLTPAAHLALSAQLKPLREQGVLIVASGNTVHNLRAAVWQNRAAAPTVWASAFDAFVDEAFEAGNAGALTQLAPLGETAQLAHPTPEHYLPLLYALGVRHEGDRAYTFYEGFDYGTISMRSFLLA